MLLPVLKKPEIKAGVVMATRLMLNKPDTVLPELITPDTSTPAFARPELPMAPDEELKKPELLAPEFRKPDALPAPLLKNPDDGALVELKKPGLPKIRPWWSPRHKKPLLKLPVMKAPVLTLPEFAKPVL
ncbi:Uncharacterised protein [Mycobacterium tuberculosis]|nr:Uncharacterised protein [Mycobacterium tuberculosis]